MAQTSFTSALNTYTEGQLVSDRLNSKIVSGKVDDSNGIALARFMGATDADETQFSNLYSNQATIVLDADLVTSNSVACSIVVNGVTTALTATVFASSHLATMQAIETKLEAVDGILSATVGGASNRTITILADPETDIYVSVFTVTLGASQAVATLANTCTLTIMGPSVQEELAPQSDGSVIFEDTEAVGALRKGNIAIQADGSIAASGTVYVRFYEESASNKKRGMLSTSAGSSPTKAIALTAGTYKVEQAMSASALGVLALNNA